MASPFTTSTSSEPRLRHRNGGPGTCPGRAAALWRNIFMGRPISGRRLPQGGAMREITSRLMGESMGFTSAALTPDTSVTGCRAANVRVIAIVRALHFQADIIILDEPTMGLYPRRPRSCSGSSAASGPPASRASSSTTTSSMSTRSPTGSSSSTGDTWRVSSPPAAIRSTSS